ncbi:Hypothetical protein CINCED_3A004729 [Cinara cedri]|uniref:Uncharacterized protein n=1 Tax=Cinara cedri TaxID=506608 RepID=A0A5E4NSU7_9HEMI|nr:Hypothetical protein CINCED_3A004729 [Cinara cedri]
MYNTTRKRARAFKRRLYPHRANVFVTPFLAVCCSIAISCAILRVVRYGRRAGRGRGSGVLHFAKRITGNRAFDVRAPAPSFDVPPCSLRNAKTERGHPGNLPRKCVTQSSPTYVHARDNDNNNNNITAADTYRKHNRTDYTRGVYTAFTSYTVLLYRGVLWRYV